MSTIIKEITPLTQKDSFTIFSRVKKAFNFPLHFHDVYELNLIVNARGAKRMVGDHEEVIDEIELVLVAPNLSHAWFTHECKSEAITEVTIHWQKDLFDEKFLKKKQMSVLKDMLVRADRGILFSKETATLLMGRIKDIGDKKGFSAIMELMNILHELSLSEGMKVLSAGVFDNDQILNHNSRRIDKAYDYMNANFQKQLTLKNLAQLISMSDVSFSRFISQRTGITFVDTLNEIRLGHATRMLIETSLSIAEISVNCGFNNISNFNRIFKKKKQCTPKEFRENSLGLRVFI